MKHEGGRLLETSTVLEDITRTLLYEGYSLYPYHRGSLKNQKPIPFGVVFPKSYSVYNPLAKSATQTECIITRANNVSVNITVRFLQLLKTKIEKTGNKNIDGDPLNNSNNSGWQTIERKISSGYVSILQLTKDKIIIPITFGKLNEKKNIEDDNSKVVAKQITTASAINGSVSINATRVNNVPGTFRITIKIANSTAVKDASKKTRDEVLSQSFLSTHTILKADRGEFISHQDPAELLKTEIEQCVNINSWPILIDQSNTTMLSSPIILYDHPKIHPQSAGDLFDSTEIEEALLLHVAMLSPGEKNSIAESDEKLGAMLNRVSQVTPEEMIRFHSGLKDIYNEK